MKKIVFQLSCAWLLLLSIHTSAQQQGRLVINEYMGWPSSGCGTTSEFIELLNFGPGPVNMGCFIITTGTYSITIPPGTVLQPGEFYVIAGQDYLPGTCANVDSSNGGVTVDLNWNTCQCTSSTIPTSGNGLFTDGGNGNTPLILMDDHGVVIDAVARSLPAEASKSITSSSVSGACIQRTFDTDAMNINYEVLGMSPGRGNSFARVVDGDCNWVKDPQQSANASNNRSGDVAGISYDFTMVNTTDCDSLGGSVSIYVRETNYDAVFPMSYTIVIDEDNNGIYDENDTYTTVVDDVPPFIEIDSLPAGRFRVTIGSVKGCFLRSFDFNILHCQSTLPVHIKSFGVTPRSGYHVLDWQIENIAEVEELRIEASNNGRSFSTLDRISGAAPAMHKTSFLVEQPDDWKFFRLMIITKSGKTIYSKIVSPNSGGRSEFKFGPNPVTNKLTIQVPLGTKGQASFQIFNQVGSMVAEYKKKGIDLQEVITMDVGQLKSGIYHLRMLSEADPIGKFAFSFVKY